MDRLGLAQKSEYFQGMEPFVPPAVQALAPRFLELLNQWNGTHALTALPPEARFEELILDACALLPLLSGLPSGAQVADFGTGMGIPALVLAMARPDLRIRAVDKSRKKVAFVRQVGLELGLVNLLLVAARAEELPPLSADLGTAKAVGSLELLTGWWTQHGKPGAPLLLPKGESWRSDPCPPGWDLEVHPYGLPTRGERVILRLTQKPAL